MRAAILLAFFFGLLPVFFWSNDAMAACEAGADCLPDSSVTQMAELQHKADPACATGAGKPCYSSSQIDQALSTIMCGNGFETGDCQFAQEKNAGKPTEGMMPADGSKMTGVPYSLAFELDEDDGC